MGDRSRSLGQRGRPVRSGVTVLPPWEVVPRGRSRGSSRGRPRLLARKPTPPRTSYHYLAPPWYTLDHEARAGPPLVGMIAGCRSTSHESPEVTSPPTGR